MSTGVAMGILSVSIMGIVFLCIKVKVHAFVALSAATLFMALASGMPLGEIGKAIESGMGGTLGFLAPILGLGAIIGKLMEISGGAERLAKTLINLLGRTKAHWAMLIVGYVCGIPVFFQVGVILLIALMFSVVRESKLPVLTVALSMIAGLITVHCIVPPHPAAMAIAGQLNADVGRVIVFGLLVGFPAAALAGPIFGKIIGSKYPVAIPAAYSDAKARSDAELPHFGSTLIIILLPLLLMVSKTVFDVVAGKDSSMGPVISFIGNPIVALFISCVVSYIFLGYRRGFSLGDLGRHSDISLNPMASILLVIGAAGAFNKVIMASGMGTVLESVLMSIQVSPLITAWVIAAIMRFAIGSATVAMMTSAGFILPLLSVHPELDPALFAIAIGAGAIGFSHVTDSGFWFVKECLNVPVDVMYKTYTVSTTIAAVVGLIGTLILSLFL